MIRGFRAAIAGALLTLGGLPAQSETVLRFNNFLPPMHTQVVNVFQPWAEQVAKATEGRVRIEILPASLAAPPRMFDLVESGGVDIAWGVTAYAGGRFKLPKVAELPFLANSSEALSVAYWKVHEEMLAQAGEFNGLKVLTVYTAAPGILFTRGPAPKAIEDFGGLKLRGSGDAPLAVARALGAAGVTGSSAEIYEMLARRVVDGALFSREAYVSYKLSEVVKSELSVPGGLYNAAVSVIMNQEKWDSLSKADQDAIWSVSGEALARMGGQAWDKADREAEALMIKDGILERATAGGALLDAMRTRLAPVEEAWIEEAGAAGVDGRKVLARLRELVAEAEK